MKSQTQTIIALAVLVALIGGITFLRQWIFLKEGDKVTDDGPPSNAVTSVEVVFPIREGSTGKEVEVNTQGHYDFLFDNPNAQPVEMGLNSKSCTCAEVKVLFLTPEEERTIQRLRLARSSLGFVPPVGPLSALAMTPALFLPVMNISSELRDFLQRATDWQTLQDIRVAQHEGTEEKLVTVPPRPVGVVRLGWKGQKPGPERFSAKLWVQQPGDPRTRSNQIELATGVLLVPAVRLYPETPPSIVLQANEHQRVEFLCWSSTRPQFKLVPVADPDNLNFVCTCTRLTGTAFDRALEELNKKVPTRALCLYQVAVDVYEQSPTGNRPLDLGPFQKTIILTTDQLDIPELTFHLSGTVRGDILFGTGDDRDWISFKTFPANKVASTTVPLESTRPGLELSVLSKKPEYLEVRLEKKGASGGLGGTRWDLTVTVPARRASGRFPQDSAIVLKMDSKASPPGLPPRLIRIPVRGLATVSLDSR